MGSVSESGQEGIEGRYKTPRTMTFKGVLKIRPPMTSKVQTLPHRRCLLILHRAWGWLKGPARS